jgi:hypothetical protein
MSTNKLAELEQRLVCVEHELEVAREQNRALRQRHERTSRMRSALFVCGLLTFGLIITMAGLPASKAQNPKTVTMFEAPFRVVDKNKQTIMEIDEASGVHIFGKGLRVFNDQGIPVVNISPMAESKGGRVAVRDGKGGNGHVTIGYPADGPNFVMKRNSEQFLAIANEKGFVWYNNNGLPAISLGAGEDGSKGIFKIADESGTAVVEAGSLTGGRGIVRVWPSRGQTPPNIPQCLMGSKK